VSRQRSKRRLILDRLERCLTAETECIRRLEEISGFYAEAEEQDPSRYVHLIAMVDELIKGHKALNEAYITFYNEAKP